MLETLPIIERVPGFRAAGIHAGLKADGALDMALIVSQSPCVAAGVFTTNHVKAAPVLVDMEKLAAARTGYRAVVVNTRCANACTGQQGIANAHEMARATAACLDCDEAQVLVMSTGVIGTHLPMPAIRRGIELAAAALGDGWEAAARGIMTTDTRPKLASLTVKMADGRHYTLAGISKGAGMIAPNMATMLALVVTDAALTPAGAQTALAAAGERTFNRIVVDGDMSTNDTLLLLANGVSGAALESAAALAQFQAALAAVCRKLAQDIVRDGEGVTKFITLHVAGAPDDAAAHRIANAIATSPLVKTAFFGADANWGRIVAAAGRAGVRVEPERMQLWLAAGECEERPDAALRLFAAGMPTDYQEAQAAAIMRQPALTIWLDCGLGAGAATVWTCDLSHDYVSINGDYRS